MTEQLPVHVSLTPRPFSMKRVGLTAVAGLTIEKIMEEALPDPILRAHCHVELGGFFIPRENWRVVKPKPGTLLVARVIPGDSGGNGGKNPLNTILMVAVIAASVAFGPELGAALMGTSAIDASLAAGLTFGTGIAITNAVGTALIGLTGMLLVNALVPVKPPSLGQQSGGTTPAESPTLFINGAQNQLLPFGVVPRVFGKVRMTPPLGARSYTEIAGANQYLRLLLCWGYGPISLTDFKIGETSIDSFEDVEVEHRFGYPDDTPLTLFPGQVSEAQLAALLEHSGSTNTPEAKNIALNGDGAWHQFTVQACDRIELDFNFPEGARYDTGQQDPFTQAEIFDNVSPAIEVQVSPVGAGQWSAPAVFDLSARLAVTGAGQVTYTPINDFSYSFSFRLQGDSNNGLDIRVRRLVDPSPSAGVLTQAIKTLNAWVMRTSQPNADELSVDFVFPQGIAHFNSNGSRSASSVQLLIQYRLSGDVAWTTPAGGFRTVSDTRTSVVRDTLRWTVPRGQYDVRCSRFSDDPPDNNTLNQSQWSVLRTFTNEDPISLPGMAKTAIRIRATGQLSGEVNQINGVVQAILPDWDSATQTWITRATTNPAAAFRATLEGAGNKRPLSDDRLDLDSIQHFSEVCTAKGRAYNRVHDFQSSVWSTLSDICTAGIASPKMVDGKWGVVIDEVRDAPVQHFTPRNSWGFQVMHLYPTRPHALRVRFVNEGQGYAQDERIVYDDGYNKTNATLFEQFEIPGVTNTDQIWEGGRHHLAVGRLRPNQYQLNADFENLVCTRGDWVKIGHDVIAVGISHGRVKSVTANVNGNVTQVTLDEECPVDGTTSYGLVFRVPGVGSVTSVVSALPAGTYKTLPLAAAIPAAQAPSAGDIFTFGVAGSETLDCLVLKIQPSSDMSAQLTLVDYSPAVFDASSGTIPEYTSLLSPPIGLFSPAIVSIRSDEQVLAQLPDGTLVPRVIVSFGFISSRASTVTGLELQWREVGAANWKSVSGDKNTNELEIVGVTQGIQYELRARFTTFSTPGPWTATVLHTVVGMSTVPADIPWLVLEGNRLRWTYPNPPLDLAGFQVRSIFGTERNWNLAIPAHEHLLTTTDFDASAILTGTRVIMVKAIDKAGNESANFAFIETNLGDPDLGNVVVTVPFTPAFNGVITSGQVIGGVLKANDDGGLYLANGTALYLGADDGVYLPTQFLDMYFDVSYQFAPDALRGQDMVSALTTVVGTPDYSYRQFRDALYLPTGADLYLPNDGDEYLPPEFTSPDWLSWPGKVAIPEDNSIVGLRFRTHMAAGVIRGEISDLELIVDTPDIKESHQDQYVPAGGARLPITNQYRSIVSVRANLLNGSAASSLVIVDRDPTLGPLVKGLDAALADADALVDYTIEGY